MFWGAERAIAMVAVIVDLCIQKKSADNRAVGVSVFEVTAKRCVLCFIAVLDGVGQLEICFWCRRRIGYGMQLFCGRKPSPRLRQNEKLDVVCPPCL